MTTRKGLFIAIEGPDGCGKTTLAKAMYNLLRDSIRIAYGILHTAEPTHGVWGTKARDRFKLADDSQPYLDAILFHLDRLDHVRGMIAPALERDYVIILDRYWASTVVFQALHGVDHNLVWALSANLPQPDYWVFPDVPNEVAWARIMERGDAAIEKADKSLFDRSYRMYQNTIERLSIHHNVIVTDGEEETKDQLDYIIAHIPAFRDCT